MFAIRGQTVNIQAFLAIKSLQQLPNSSAAVALDNMYTKRQGFCSTKASLIKYTQACSLPTP